MLVHKCQTRENLKHDVPYFILSKHLIFPDAREFHKKDTEEKIKEKQRQRIRKVQPYKMCETECFFSLIKALKKVL